MRQRFLHRGGSLAPSIAQLIQSHDVLSSREQEDVILYLARNLRYTVILLRFVSALHFVLVALYLCMFFTGVSLVDVVSPVVVTSCSQKLGKSLSQTSSWSKSLRHLTKDRGQVARVAVSASGKNGAGDSLRRAHYSHLVSSSYLSIPSLTVLLSGLLLLLGGICVWRACRGLLVNTDELLGQASPLGPPRPLRSEYEEYCPEAGCVASARTRAQSNSYHRTLPLGSRAVVVHAVLSILSTLTSLYWFYLLFKYYTTRMLYDDARALRVKESKLPEYVCVIVDVMLVVWQPLFHAAVGAILTSTFAARQKLLKLSLLRYSFEK